jgi:hypothetical protein
MNRKTNNQIKATVLEDVFNPPPPQRQYATTNSSGIKGMSEVNNNGLQYGGRPPVGKSFDSKFTLIDDNYSLNTGPEPPRGDRLYEAQSPKGDRFSNPDPRLKSKALNSFSNHNGLNLNRDFNIVAESETDTIRGAVAEMYPDVLTVKVVDNQGFGIYKAIIDTMTSGDTKYIVLIVPRDSQTRVGTQRYVSQLPWVSFQTRSTEEIYKEMNGFKLSPQPYQLASKKSLLYDKIRVVEERPDRWVYKPENVNVKVELLKRKPEDQFAQEGYIANALEAFRTIITIVS